MEARHHHAGCHDAGAKQPFTGHGGTETHSRVMLFVGLTRARFAARKPSTNSFLIQAYAEIGHKRRPVCRQKLSAVTHRQRPVPRNRKGPISSRWTPCRRIQGPRLLHPGCPRTPHSGTARRIVISDWEDVCNAVVPVVNRVRTPTMNMDEDKPFLRSTVGIPPRSRPSPAAALLFLPRRGRGRSG